MELIHAMIMLIVMALSMAGILHIIELFIDKIEKKKEIELDFTPMLNFIKETSPIPKEEKEAALKKLASKLGIK